MTMTTRLCLHMAVTGFTKSSSAWDSDIRCRMEGCSSTASAMAVMAAASKWHSCFATVGKNAFGFVVGWYSCARLMKN
ncbi:hypothetical protein C8J57DRAFT_1341249 [Mycena rebaudengoi]|nr:hypothetical protein C8J57DRAFT_1341249 [Mycena rebaudengoi]